MTPATAKPSVATAGATPSPAKPKEVVEAYSFRRHGWPRVRRPAITFGVALLLSIGLVSAGRIMLNRTIPETAAAHEQHVAARERLSQAQLERDEIRQFQSGFGALRARGFVGPEDRLAMLEAIRDLQRAHALLPITYEFAPQQLVALDPALLGAPLELRSTTVTLHLQLLHEMDLVHFMRDLKTKGVFAVKDCLLTSTGDATGDASQARLTADCTLFWLSIGETPATPPPGS